MVNLTRIFICSLTASSLTILFTVFIFLLAIEQPILFWLILSLFWFLESFIIGLLLNNFGDSFLSGLIMGAILFFPLFFSMLLIRSFAEAFIGIFFSAGDFSSDPDKLILQALGSSVIIALSLSVTSSIFCTFGSFLRRRLAAFYPEISTQDIESKQFKKYEPLVDSGDYSRLGDEEKAKEDFEL